MVQIPVLTPVVCVTVDRFAVSVFHYWKGTKVSLLPRLLLEHHGNVCVGRSSRQVSQGTCRDDAL